MTETSAVPATLSALPFLEILIADFWRYALGAGGVYLLVNRLFARRLAERKIRPDSPGWPQLRREILYSLRTVVVFAGFGGSIHVLESRGVISLAEESSAAQIAIHALALIVLHDAWFYWTHRLIHLPRLFRRFHRVHHRSHNPSPFAAYSFDLGEAAINAAFLPLALIILPPTPLPALLFFLAHMIIRNALGHSGYEIAPASADGRPRFDWLTSVTHHDLHHADARWNYGLYFTFWDRAMGTEHPFYRERFAIAVRKPLDGSAVGALGATRAPTSSGRSLILFGVCLAVAVMAPAANSASPTPTTSYGSTPAIPDGLWATEGSGAHVRFFECPEKARTLCGEIIWTWDPALFEQAKATRFLGGFRWTDGAWRDGWLRDPESGDRFRGTMTPEGDGVLRLRGCALIFCRSQVWRRLDLVPGCTGAEPSSF